MIMEFEELQKIWDSQNNHNMYAINEQALHNRILSKKKQVYYITNVSELLLIFVNISAGAFVLGTNFFNARESIFLYSLSLWMFGSAFYLILSRIRRIASGLQFDRSLRGDLAYAISIATYQVRLSQLMRWNILPIGTLVILGVWNSGRPIWVALGILVFFLFAHYAGGWEHSIYKNKKRELETLQSKLTNETPGSDHS
jgi:hypothetical protein